MPGNHHLLKTIMIRLGKRCWNATSGHSWSGFSRISRPKSTGRAATNFSTNGVAENRPAGEGKAPLCRQAGESLAAGWYGNLGADPHRNPGGLRGRIRRTDVRLLLPAVRPLPPAAGQSGGVDR